MPSWRSGPTTALPSPTPDPCPPRHGYGCRSRSCSRASLNPGRCDHTPTPTALRPGPTRACCTAAGRAHHRSAPAAEKVLRKLRAVVGDRAQASDAAAVHRATRCPHRRSDPHNRARQPSLGLTVPHPWPGAAPSAESSSPPPAPPPPGANLVDNIIAAIALSTWNLPIPSDPQPPSSLAA